MTWCLLLLRKQKAIWQKLLHNCPKFEAWHYERNLEKKINRGEYPVNTNFKICRSVASCLYNTTQSLASLWHLMHLITHQGNPWSFPNLMKEKKDFPHIEICWLKQKDVTQKWLLQKFKCNILIYCWKFNIWWQSENSTENVADIFFQQHTDKLQKLSLKDQSQRLKCLGGREEKHLWYSCQRKLSPDLYAFRLLKTKDTIKYLTLPTQIED